MIPRLSLALFLLPWTVLSLPGQQIFNAGQTALVRRFAVNGSHDLEDLLQLANDDDLDVWQVTPSHIDIYFPPGVPNTLSEYSFTENVIVHEYAATHSGPWNLSSLAYSPYHAAYHPLYEIDDFLREIESLYPDIAQIQPLGHSGRGREMYAIRLSRQEEGAVQKRDDKPGFVIVGAQHAREWVATAASLYLTHALVANASEAHSLSHLLDHFDFYIIPSPNPDGYAHTWEDDRFWYKNRMIVGPHAKCVGVDMNRNWGYKWKPTAKDTVSSSRRHKGRQAPVDPCSHWYPGSRPFEAPEVNNLANYITTLPNLQAFVDLRAYGQFLSSPFSYSCKKTPKDAEDQLEAAHGAAAALKKAYGTQFMAGSLCSMLYRAPGNIVDWMYKEAGIKYTYAAHLRDTGTYGFALPPEWIRPVGEETANMIEYLAKFIVSRM